MAKPIINGSNKVNRKPVQFTCDPRSGPIVRYMYSQAGGWDKLLPYCNSARNLGCKVDLLMSPVLSTLSVDSPELFPGANEAQEIITDTWEVSKSLLSKNISENSRIKNDSGIPFALLEVVACAVKNGQTLADAVTFLETSTSETYADPSGYPKIIQLYKECVKGQDSFGFSQYVLRHTTNVSQNSLHNVSDDNVDMLYTTAQLLSEAQNGALWINTIPQRLRSKILSIPAVASPSSESSYYLWSWKKEGSTETSSSNRRVNIVTEYSLDLWSTLRYAPLS